MSNCKGCKWQSTGVTDDGSKIKYCIGSPNCEPKYGSAALITSERIIKCASGDVYRANDDDECHLWHSDRFERGQP